MQYFHTRNSLFFITLAIVITSVVSIFTLIIKLEAVKKRIKEISDTLDDISGGNNDRKFLIKPHDITSEICYKFNQIALAHKQQMVEQKRTEEATKQLITSLSHDARTPLASIIGYLDAVHKGIVTGQERESYIESARLQSHDMKDYVDVLFEWFKLNSDEEIFQIEKTDLTEATRDTLKKWIPIFEINGLEYEIDIPEQNISVNLDSDAYTRILNNIIQNVMVHSKASKVTISLNVLNEKVEISIKDNGHGISPADLPYIFNRLYKCDKARTAKGSGLGLSITKQLVEKMGGTICAASSWTKYTVFHIQFPLNRP